MKQLEFFSPILEQGYLLLQNLSIQSQMNDFVSSFQLAQAVA